MRGASTTPGLNIDGPADSGPRRRSTPARAVFPLLLAAAVLAAAASLDAQPALVGRADAGPSASPAESPESKAVSSLSEAVVVGEAVEGLRATRGSWSPTAGLTAPSSRGAGDLSVFREVASRKLADGDVEAALEFARRAHRGAPDEPETWILLARLHLVQGSVDLALHYVEAALGEEPSDQEALAIQLRAWLVSGRDTETSEAAARWIGQPLQSASLASALGAVWFKAGDTDLSAEFYTRALELDPADTDALLRLGSGLGPAHPADVVPGLLRAVEDFDAGRLEQAEAELLRVRATDPEHPTVLRLLGELNERRRGRGFVDRLAPAVEPRLWAEHGSFDAEVARAILPQFDEFEGSRLRVIERTLSAFGSRLRALRARRARHDLLGLAERTTAAIERQGLRGRRTFDGRLWDDVRGLGGLRAATGIEALDDAALLGFDTFAHEIAHQVHFYAFDSVLRRRIDDLYTRALDERCCLDGYAASSAAEYFAQGVEAFLSLAKRPLAVVTHGHTRFELAVVDPRLHALISELVDRDPLAPGAPGRDRILESSVEALLKAGRIDTAQTAASWIEDGTGRSRALQRCRLWRTRFESL